MEPRLPLLRDPAAARIVPFIVFMATALLASALSETPALLYPLRAIAVAAALFAFRDLYLSLPWRPDPLAVAAGVAVGVAWVLTAPAVEEDPALAAALSGLGAAATAVWIASRVLGTAVLVPLVEELFFRGYLLSKIDRGGWTRVLAIVVSTALFAALHDRWVAAALAGVVFALLALRRTRLADAVWSHAAANAVIAAVALATGRWTLI